MRRRILEVLGVVPLPATTGPVYQLPSGLRVALSTACPGRYRVLAPGPYAFAVGHELADADVLMGGDMQALAAQILGLPVPWEALRASADPGRFLALVETVRPAIDPLLGAAAGRGLAFLIADPAAEVLGAMPVAPHGEALRQVAEKSPTLPLVLLFEREPLARRVKQASRAEGFAAVAAELRETPRAAEVLAVVALGWRLATVRIPLVPRRPASPGAPS